MKNCPISGCVTKILTQIAGQPEESAFKGHITEMTLIYNPRHVEFAVVFRFAMFMAMSCRPGIKIALAEHQAGAGLDCSRI